MICIFWNDYKSYVESCMPGRKYSGAGYGIVKCDCGNELNLHESGMSRCLKCHTAVELKNNTLIIRRNIRED